MIVGGGEKEKREKRNPPSFILMDPQISTYSLIIAVDPRIKVYGGFTRLRCASQMLSLSMSRTRPACGGEVFGESGRPVLGTEKHSRSVHRRLGSTHTVPGQLTGRKSFSFLWLACTVIVWEPPTVNREATAKDFDQANLSLLFSLIIGKFLRLACQVFG